MQNQIKPNQTIIQFKLNEALPAQSDPITIHFELDRSGYSGLITLLRNPEILALKENGATLSKETASYLQSAIEATANTLGDAFQTLCIMQSELCATQRETSHITPFLISDFGAMISELLPFFARLSAELATDEARQSPNPVMKGGL